MRCKIKGIHLNIKIGRVFGQACFLLIMNDLALMWIEIRGSLPPGRPVDVREKPC
jgi:hypothetical protein